MTVPPGREHTAHLYYLRMPTEDVRDRFIAHMASRGVSTPFHYVPLDSSPAGLKMGRTPTPCARSASFSHTIARLPVWPSMTNEQVTRVLEAVTAFSGNLRTALPQESTRVTPVTIGTQNRT